MMVGGRRRRRSEISVGFDGGVIREMSKKEVSIRIEEEGVWSEESNHFSAFPLSELFLILWYV